MDSDSKIPDVGTPLILLDTSEIDIKPNDPPCEPAEIEPLKGNGPFKSENQIDIMDTALLTPTPPHFSLGIGQLHSSTGLQESQAIDPWDHNKYELDIGQLGPAPPPDGGWGWMIVVGSFMCLFLVDGMCFSYGIFLRELEDTFKASKRKMTLAGALLTGCYLLMGPVTSALANKFGFRAVIISGAILSSASFFVSAFIYNLDVFIFIYGICGGIGYGLIYLPSVTVISLWFEDRRATATGIAVCGSSIGSTVYGFLLPYLIDEYTWRGCVIILSGISLNCAVAGALFRPLSDYQEKHSKRKEGPDYVQQGDGAVVHSQHIGSQINSPTIISENRSENILSKMLDFSILKSPIFILLASASCAAMLGFIVPFQFLTDNSQHLGYGADVSSYLMSILGAANTIGRILSGILSDQKWADCLWIHNGALVVAGGATMLLPLCKTYALLSLYSCVFGLFIAAFAALRTIVVLELVGMDRLTNAFGYLLLLQGIFIILGPPVLGSFFDTLKNYDYTFILGGACLVLAGVLGFPFRLVSKWENKRNSGLDDAGTCDQSESAM